MDVLEILLKILCWSVLGTFVVLSIGTTMAFIIHLNMGNLWNVFVSGVLTFVMMIISLKTYEFIIK